MSNIKEDIVKKPRKKMVKMTQEEYDKLIETSEKMMNDAKYIAADAENYKKRTEASLAAKLKYKDEDILKDMLSVLDDLDRSLDVAYDAGIEIIRNKMYALLSEHGLEYINVKDNDTFDDNIHYAIMTQTTLDEAANNTIQKVVEKGYKLYDKIIRYPKVIVYKYIA